MYRDDREALLQQAESATREAERLRRENEAMRLAVSHQAPRSITTLALPNGAAYKITDLRYLPLEERARLAMHSIERFPVWLVAILNVLTFGIFPLIHFGLMHDRLPRASGNDPGAGKAIGFTFIPYFNFYWVFFNALRLADRLNLQFRLRGVPDAAPRGLLIGTCVVTVIPYVNIAVGIPIMWTIAVCFLQATVNRVAALSPATWDATTLAPDVAPLPSYAMVAPTSEQLAEQARAARLVRWSHILGWGGLGMLLVGSIFAAVIAGGMGAAIVASLSGLSVIVGAIVGQVGRGMQGRAI